jgi:hypothetical protein
VFTLDIGDRTFLLGKNPLAIEEAEKQVSGGSRQIIVQQIA